MMQYFDFIHIFLTIERQVFFFLFDTVYSEKGAWCLFPFWTDISSTFAKKFIKLHIHLVHHKPQAIIICFYLMK